jgi:hypothetical protein
VWIPKKGMIPPEEFISCFGGMPWCAKPIYRGIFHKQLIQDVHEGRHPVVEGMVCKGLKGDWAVKIKMLSYFEKLKTNYGQDWVKYAE